MKKRLIVLIVFTVLLLVSYTGVYFFILNRRFENISLEVVYILPFSVLAVTLLALLFCLGLFNKTAKEHIDLIEKLDLQQKLNKDYIDSNEIIMKNLPVGIIIYADNYLITYANEFSEKIFQSVLLGKKLKYVFGDLIPFLDKKENSFDIDIYGKKYHVMHNYRANSFYLLDKTKESSIENKFNIMKPSIAILYLENLNQSLATTDLEKKTGILGRYYSCIEKWREKYNIFALSASNDRQLFVIKNETLEELEEEQFSVLQEVDDISKELDLEISLSIGIGTGSLDYETLGFYAEDALSFASDRGGNQAVVNDGEERKAYGGHIQYTERKTKTTARIVSQKLLDVIKNSSSVVILPHTDSDADAIGGAFGVLTFCEAVGTPAKVLVDFDHIDTTVAKIIENSHYEYIKLQQSLITGENINDFFTGKSLLIVVDHHDMKLSANKEIYKKAGQVIIIDHHRLTDKLEIEASLQYIDHNASSSVELITELISLASTDIKIPPYIATLMLTGMLIDTQNFASHTDERTFEAAAYLTASGADLYKAKMYLREPISEQIARVKLLEKVEIVHEKYAVIIDDSGIVARDHLAKTAQSLLNIDNITAGFAIGFIDKDTINVSGRGNGSLNIHAIMETLGGGGHFNVGAAQIKNSTLKIVHDAITAELNKSTKEEENTMKIILIEDVKRQGKKGDILEVTPGYGNFLLSKKQAVEANASNISALEEEKASLERHLQEEFEVAEKLKKILDPIIVKIVVKVGMGGKAFGSVSSKQIADELQKQHNIIIDKRKLILPEDKVTSLGTYQVIAKLHKDVTSTFTIEVIEEREV